MAKKARESLDLNKIYPATGGELFFGFVSPVGTETKPIVDEFEKKLRGFSYEVKRVRMSDLILQEMKCDITSETGEYDRIRTLQKAGNKLRRKFGADIVATHACAEVGRKREKWPAGEPKIARTAYFFETLKHSSEASLFRTIYGHGFFLVAVHGSFGERVRRLVSRGMSKHEAKKLIEKDDQDAPPFGQDTRGTFELADFFLRDSQQATQAINRFISLIFGHLYFTPTRDEYGMHLAVTSSYRSADLGRQVGAAILNSEGDVLSVGCNEVPKAGGGSYWPSDTPDYREFRRTIDANDAEKDERFNCLWEYLKLKGSGTSRETFAEGLSISGLRDITEFGRAVHAEMDALMSCARRGVSASDAILYTSTFPCHNCARHIIASGLQRVVYIEPYAKSQAYDLHSDSIECEALRPPALSMKAGAQSVKFEAFEGVAPRRYADFFSMRRLTGERIERKRNGKIIDPAPAGSAWPRLPLSVFSYLKREEFAISSVAGRVKKK